MSQQEKTQYLQNAHYFSLAVLTRQGLSKILIIFDRQTDLIYFSPQNLRYKNIK